MGVKWRDFQMPKRLDCDESTYTETYGRFIAEPFEKGYGVTLGNSLRRILLSSIEGSAITSIKIEGVRHEYSTIPGVMESVSEIILNLKRLVLRSHKYRLRTLPFFFLLEYQHLKFLAYFYPCLCLCFGLEQITRTTFLRRTILQFPHILLTDALTFILFIPICYAPSR